MIFLVTLLGFLSSVASQRVVPVPFSVLESTASLQADDASECAVHIDSLLVSRRFYNTAYGADSRVQN